MLGQLKGESESTCGQSGREQCAHGVNWLGGCCGGRRHHQPAAPVSLPVGCTRTGKSPEAIKDPVETDSAEGRPDGFS